jgi:hypothetical protein
LTLEKIQKPAQRVFYCLFSETQADSKQSLNARLDPSFAWVFVKTGVLTAGRGINIETSTATYTIETEQGHSRPQIDRVTTLYVKAGAPQAKFSEWK